MERQSGAIESRVGCRPAGNDHADQTGNANGVIDHGAERNVFGFFIAALLHAPIDQQQSRAKPSDAMAEKHPRSRSPTAAGFLGKAQDGKIGHAHVHRTIAEPSKEKHRPESLGGDDILGWCQSSDDISRVQFAQNHQRTCEENQEHPWCSNFSNTCDKAVAFHGNECHGGTNQHDEHAPRGIGRHRGGEIHRFHGFDEGSERCGRDRDHRACKEAEEHPIRDVVNIDEIPPGDFLELIVKRESCSGSDRRGNVAP